MSNETDEVQDLTVTFKPPLYLQRRGWVLDIMRREGVREVVDIGCGEGELLACLCNPAPWLAPPAPDATDERPAHRAASPAPDLTATAAPLDADDVCADALAALHRDVLHPVRIAGLDVCAGELACASQITAPLPPPSSSSSASASASQEHAWWSEPARWEPLEVELWEGSLADVNPAFVGAECIVATEVIEHLPSPVLARFAPVLLGRYRPRLLLLTTPSYTFNARFSAPDTPPAALALRSGGHADPTGRTERVFRHADHKFEWTPAEFAAWCNDAAAEWGYALELGGVGRAAEEDPWGRDAELGWASQTAAFTRLEGAEWEARRAVRWAEVDEGASGREGEEETAHQLVIAHRHDVHEAAGRLRALEEIGELVVSTLAEAGDTAAPLPQLWFARPVELACGGLVDRLVEAVRAHDGLVLRRAEVDPDGGQLLLGSHQEWVIELDPSLHHLVQLEHRLDPWTSPSPPDSEESVDRWDPYDDDVGWGERRDGVVVREADEGVKGTEVWTAVDTEDAGWGTSCAGWGKGSADTSVLQEWGEPEGYEA